MRSPVSFLALALGLAAAAAATVGAAGCTTEAFCFDNCNGSTTSSSGSGTTGTGTGGSGGNIFPTGGSGGCFLNCSGSTSSSSGTCVPSNGGVEICDGLDNDCNGVIDDITDLDLKAPQTCGTCSNNCYAIPNSFWAQASIKCAPAAQPGQPGTCSGQCTQDYFDFDGDGKCESYCFKTAATDTTCNGIDDDCNGKIDDGVDFCTDVNNCGACNHPCVVAHGTGTCVAPASGTCDLASTHCAIAACDPGFLDLDGSYATGCEYQCTPTNGGVEICDGIDNDCNGTVDDNIPSQPCQGGTKGVCADPANAGNTACVAGTMQCVGAKVVKPGERPETCNNLDDDCDGAVDNNPTDAGGSCGVSNIFPCSFGKKVCQGGSIICVGNVDPASSEVCDGIDNDCNGQIDDNPTDAMGACNVPTPPPAGATSACKAGVKKCAGGTVQCVGSVTAVPGAVDSCGVDANCDGALTNQPNTQTDVHNCGTCGNDCTAGAHHSQWSCVAGACVFQGCQAGYYDNGGPGDAVAGDNKCDYACTFVSAQEACNGQDDNCDGKVDEGVIAPTPVQVCGVSPQATATECTSGVTVACVSGAWKCTFPAGVCDGGNPPKCSTTTEICDGLDNNCNGSLNENVANYGKPCASDDGAPGTQGVCRTTGTYVCNGTGAVKCSAVKADCATLPGGCTEICDGLDNDCDGSVDETFQNKGSNPTYFLQPAVTKIASSLWIYSYEASRPNAKPAVGSNPASAGTGNGYQCNTAPCASGITGPAGVPLDKTLACSVPSRLPWANVTPIEARQTCFAMGGHLCSTAEWQTACITKPPSATACTFGYAPLGTDCNTSYVAGTKFCNLGPSYDSNSSLAGDQDGLLETASSALKNCYADWTTLLLNANQAYPGSTKGKIFDLTGNLREITQCRADASACTTANECCSEVCAAGTCGCKGGAAACTTASDCCSGVCTSNKCVGGVAGTTPTAYPLMGGAFDTADEGGATCGFTFYTVDQNFALYDLGFRCCFSQDPTL